VYSTIYFAPRKQSSQKVLGPLDGCNTMLRQSFSLPPSISDDQTYEEQMCWTKESESREIGSRAARVLL
jgi:hypothetical protein